MTCSYIFINTFGYTLSKTFCVYGFESREIYRVNFWEKLSALSIDHIMVGPFVVGICVGNQSTQIIMEWNKVSMSASFITV